MKQFLSAEEKNAAVLNAVQMCVGFHNNASANLTLTNQVSGAQFLGNSNRNITRLDLRYFNQVRIVFRVVTGSTSANDPRLIVRYAVGFTTTVGEYADIGTSEVSGSMGLSGVADSGWIPLTSAAILDDVFVTVVQIGGDGVQDPAVAMVNVYFRNDPFL